MLHLPSNRAPRTEQQVRTDLAAAYRLAALAGWDDAVYTHLSATVLGEPGVYLINDGLGFDEITASSLVKINLCGKVVDGSPGRQPDRLHHSRCGACGPARS